MYAILRFLAADGMNSETPGIHLIFCLPPSSEFSPAQLLAAAQSVHEPTWGLQNIFQNKSQVSVAFNLSIAHYLLFCAWGLCSMEDTVSLLKSPEGRKKL